MKKKHVIVSIMFVNVVLLSFYTFNLLNPSESKQTNVDVEWNDLELLNNQNGQIIPWGLEVVGMIESPPARTQDVIKIAILDSGINQEHEDLQGKVVNAYNAIAPDEPIIDDFGHGTAIASIMTAHDNDVGMVGVTQHVDIYDVKVLNEEGNGKAEHLIAGIQWCIEQQVDIMNISFGLQSANADLEQAINEAVDSGIIIVAAAGNTYGLGVDYPARYDNVLSINALKQDLKRPSSAAKGKIDFAAPGVNILSTDKDGGYSLFNGTSFATAFATGVIAVHLIEYRNKTDFNNRPQDNRDFLDAINTQAAKLGKKDQVHEYGQGLLKIK